MPQSRVPDNAQPDPHPDTDEVRNMAAPDLGGSFEENGQVRRHDGIGAAPGMQPVLKLESEKAAREQDKDSSAGS